MNKLTKWHPKHEKPVHVGVYEVKTNLAGTTCKFFSYWDGYIFGFRAISIDEAFNKRQYGTLAQPFAKWRGLMVKPKELK
jgi:hypothetical protein